ncbi:MAG: glycosyltransferase [Dickeya sp.]|uniref:Glycosyl transferase group 1 n=1 Tax=Dickeya zeae (strain Ech586) TaxID=590409 RepID=D2BSD3_DICZ5|nr:glycosyltransferase [Dickeya parazeae]ACZ75552.1 glycosyl transferase group 1 [Dickeya parazeae Ech586]PXW46871.1 glycosyltransferase involved in cell wall biosynthesis [Erwinia sp. AG740]
MADSAKDDCVPSSCIMFATADWDEPYWTNKQHCAKSLSELGIRVLYVESVGLRAPKPGSKKDWRRLWNRLYKGLSSLLFGAPECSTGVFVLSPLLIPAGHRYMLTRAINRWLLKIEIARSMWGREFVNPLVWTYHPFMLDVINNFRTSSLLYHCVDDLAEVPGIDGANFRSAEMLLLKRADVVFATAPTLAQRCKAINVNTHFLSNVVDVKHFGEALKPGPIPNDLACISEPRLCYHGVLSDFKIDFQLLLSVARVKPEWSWVFIGEEREGQKNPIVEELGKLPNVHFIGYRPYSILPEYLRGMQVGLLPSLVNEYTRSMFPMKYYEYIASGLPVVSTPLDFLRICNQRVACGENADEFIKAISEQIERGRLTAKDTTEVVGDNTWQARCLKMLAEVTCKNN